MHELRFKTNTFSDDNTTYEIGIRVEDESVDGDRMASIGSSFAEVLSGPGMCRPMLAAAYIVEALNYYDTPPSPIDDGWEAATEFIVAANKLIECYKAHDKRICVSTGV